MPEAGEIIRSEKTGRLGRKLPDGRIEVFSPGQVITSPKTGRQGRVTENNEIELMESPAPEKSGFVDRLSEDAERRGKIAFEIISAKAQGEQGWGDTLFQLAAQGANFTLDTVWNGLVTAATGTAEALAPITPDVVKDPLKDFASYSSHFMLNAAAEAGVIDAIEEGAEAYQGWKEKNPRAGRNFEATVSLGLFFAPVKLKGQTNAPAARGGVLSNAANKIDQSIPARSNKIKREYIEDLLRPIESKRNNMKAIERGQISGGGFFTNKEYKFSSAELSAIDDLMKTGIKRTGTIQQAHDAARVRVGVLERELQQSLRSSGKSFRKKQVLDDFNKLKQTTLQNNSTLMIGEQKRAVDNMFSHAHKLIRKRNNTPKDLLESKREFSRWINNQMSERALYDPTTLDSARALANSAIRKGFDDHISAMVPTAKPTLLRQSALLKATGKTPDAVLSVKAAAEPMNAITRQWGNLTKIIGLRSEFNNVMAGLFGVGGLGAAALFAPFYTAGLAVATTKYAGEKILFSAPTKKALSTLLKTTDEALKIAGASKLTAREIVPALKADRAIIQQFLDEGLFEK